MPIPEKNKGTAGPESDSGEDTAKEGAGPSGEKQDASPASKDKESVPWDKDPRWKEWRSTEKKVQELMKANDCETLDDLVDLAESGKIAKSKGLSETQIDNLIERHNLLSKYEQYWADQEKQSLPDDEKVKRLETENQKLAREKRDREERESLKAQASAYDHEVKKLVTSRDDLPEDLHEFYWKFFGVENPAVDVPLNDRKAIRQVVNDGFKTLESFRQAVIKNYIAGKEKIPSVPKQDQAADTKKPEIKNLREARKIMAEMTEKG